MTKLIVFGGTGKSGIAVIREALQQKDIEVSVYARRPERIPQDIVKRVNVIQGDVLNRQKVVEAMEGHDAVISCLGKGMNLCSTTLISEGTKNVVKAMRAHEVKKLIVVSISTRLPANKHKKGPFFLRKIAADHDRMLDYLQACDDIDWIGVMVPEIFKLPKTDDYQVAIGKRPGPITVCAADMAHFMVSSIVNERKWLTYKNTRVGISSNIPVSTIMLRTEQGRVWSALLASMVALVGWGVYKLVR